MKNNIFTQTTVALLLIVLLLFILNPFHFWMPPMLATMILVAVLVLFAFYASFVLSERAFDEREAVHRLQAGRSAYLLGSVVLMAGIIIQAFQHHLDGWLIGALVVMLVSKIVTRAYTDSTE